MPVCVWKVIRRHVEREDSEARTLAVIVIIELLIYQKLGLPTVIGD